MYKNLKILTINRQTKQCQPNISTKIQPKNFTKIRKKDTILKKPKKDKKEFKNVKIKSLKANLILINKKMD